MQNQQSAANKLLDTWYKSSCRNDWGGKGFLSWKLRINLGCTNAEALKFLKVWSDNMQVIL